MESVRKINDELSVAGHVTQAQLQQISIAGFQAVLQLRSAEENAPTDEQQQAKCLGLYYESFSVEMGAIDCEIAAKILQQIAALPKPALVCCHHATLAAAMVLMHIAMHQGDTLQQAFDRADQLGLFGLLHSHPIS